MFLFVLKRLCVIIQVMCHGEYHMSSIRVMYIPNHISQGIMSCMRIIAHIARQCIPSHTSHVITHPGASWRSSIPDTHRDPWISSTCTLKGSPKVLWNYHRISEPSKFQLKQYSNVTQITCRNTSCPHEAHMINISSHR